VILKLKRKREKHVLNYKKEEIAKEQLDVQSMCTEASKRNNISQTIK
jgi:hypothetical protein